MTPSKLLFLLFLFISTNLCSHIALNELEDKIRVDFLYLNQPAKKWLLRPYESDDVLDVAIIGGGMAGMTAALALKREGIDSICLFDENPPGFEGPWITCARMRHLRSPKAVMGPALGLPHLTFRSWYEASYGEEGWNAMKAIPTQVWQDYLCWYRSLFNIPIQSEKKLKSIRAGSGCIELIFSDDRLVLARKVVLATGREGFGGLEYPAFILSLSKNCYAHTGECINSRWFEGKTVVVVGAGASAFDAAGVAIENGAKTVNMLLRRPNIPAVNKFSKLMTPGIFYGYHQLSDQQRCLLFGAAMEAGIPPSIESVERVKGKENFQLWFETDIYFAEEIADKVVLKTSRGDISADFIVLGTGYRVDGAIRSEYADLIDDIRLWSDQLDVEQLSRWPKLGMFPYLGPHFQFLEKETGQAPYLKNIYCFNYGAFLSHGLISGDITGISIGAERLAEGIAADFFVEEFDLYFNAVQNYSTPLFIY